MIEYIGFSKHYGKLAAVSDLTLSVREGETLALVGPNGSGKTTTLKAAVGLVLASAGAVCISGTELTADSFKSRRGIGYLPQRLSFPEGCSGREVMNLFATIRGAAANEVDGLILRVGLASDADRAVDVYSGGMRQRLGIAVAMLGNPDVLVLDEPTSALDPSGALMMRDIIRGIAAEGKTVLLSSHDLAEVEALSDRVAIFIGGRMEAAGNLHELSVANACVSLEAIYRAVTQSRRAA